MRNKQYILISMRIIFLLALVGGLYLVFKNDVSTFVDENPKDKNQNEPTKIYDLNPTDNKTITQAVQEKIGQGKDKIRNSLGGGEEGTLSQKMGVKKKLTTAEIASLNKLSQSNPSAFLHKMRSLLNDNYSSESLESQIHHILEESYETIDLNLLKDLTESPICSFYFSIRGWKIIQSKEAPSAHDSKWTSVEDRLEYAAKNDIEEAKYLLATLYVSRAPSRIRSKKALSLLSQVKSLEFSNNSYGIANPYTIFVDSREPFYSSDFYLAVALHQKSAYILSLQKITPKSEKLQKVIDYIEGKSPKYLDPALKAQDLAGMARSSYNKVIGKAQGNELLIAQLLLVTLNDDPTINEPITFEINKQDSRRLFNNLHTTYSGSFSKYCLYIKAHTPSQNGLESFNLYLDNIEVKEKRLLKEKLDFMNRSGFVKVNELNGEIFRNKNKITKNFVYGKDGNGYTRIEGKKILPEGPWLYKAATIVSERNSHFLKYKVYYYKHDGKGKAVFVDDKLIQEVDLGNGIKNPVNGIIHPFFNEKKPRFGKMTGGVPLREGVDLKNSNVAHLLLSTDKIKIWPKIHPANNHLWFFVTLENGLGGFVLAHQVRVLDPAVNLAVGIPINNEPGMMFNPHDPEEGSKREKIKFLGEPSGTPLLDNYNRDVYVP